jgi:hypothetical protein
VVLDDGFPLPQWRAEESPEDAGRFTEAFVPRQAILLELDLLCATNQSISVRSIEYFDVE